MLNDVEMKLLRLALDKGAFEDEADNAAVLLIHKLRGRNASADEIISNPQFEVTGNISVYGRVRMPFGKYRGEILADIPGDYLLWLLRNCRSIKPELRYAIERVASE